LDAKIVAVRTSMPDAGAAVMVCPRK